MLCLSYPGGALELGRRTIVMGVLNVTPDSFSDGGRFAERTRAVDHALSMIAAGADIVDIGGESTRPGADPVDAATERERVVPVIEALRARTDALLSIDTFKAETAEAAVKAGARMINDISGFRGDPRMAEVAARSGVAVVLMHMQGTPRTMQADPRYGDVVADIRSVLQDSIAVAERAGIPRDRIVVDPGIGFGKRPEHNIEILRRLEEFRTLDCPILVGTSRKSFIGHCLGGKGVGERLMGTAATVAAAIFHGADIVRIHDVADLIDVVRMSDAIKRTGQTGAGQNAPARGS